MRSSPLPDVMAVEPRTGAAIDLVPAPSLQCSANAAEPSPRKRDRRGRARPAREREQERRSDEKAAREARRASDLAAWHRKRVAEVTPHVATLSCPRATPCEEACNGEAAARRCRRPRVQIGDRGRWRLPALVANAQSDAICDTNWWEPLHHSAAASVSPRVFDEVAAQAQRDAARKKKQKKKAATMNDKATFSMMNR